MRSPAALVLQAHLMNVEALEVAGDGPGDGAVDRRRGVGLPEVFEQHPAGVDGGAALGERPQLPGRQRNVCARAGLCLVCVKTSAGAVPPADPAERGGNVRITGGALRGRRIHTPASPHLRPALERPREAIFDILRERMRDAVVLDAFAGTGLLGLESLSRGAAKAVFVELHKPTVHFLETLLREWDLTDRSRVFAADFLRVAPALVREGPFDVVFVDPPYPKLLADAVLQTVARLRLLGAAGVVVVKMHHKHALTPPPELAVRDERQYGDSKVVFLGWKAEGEA
jgi:16S rRNA (guanine966-N2)-methyltransferase